MREAFNFTPSNENNKEPEKGPEESLVEETARVSKSLSELILERHLNPDKSSFDPERLIPANENDSIDSNKRVITKYEEEVAEDEDPFGPFPPMQYSPDEVRKAVERAQANDANHHLR